MRISDWSSDVCSSDLHAERKVETVDEQDNANHNQDRNQDKRLQRTDLATPECANQNQRGNTDHQSHGTNEQPEGHHRSEEHTSELQSLMRISYAVFCLKKKKNPLSIESDNN